MSLITDVELADEFGITVATLHRLRRERGWPCVKFRRNEFRFTPEQRDAIVAMQTAVPASGQTPRSAARGRS